MMKLMQVAQEMKPKIDRISDRVDSISEKVDSIASDVQGRVKAIGDTSNKIASSADLLSSIANQGVTKYAPFIAILGLALRGFQMVQQSGIKFPAKKKTVPSKAIEKPKGK